MNCYQDHIMLKNQEKAQFHCGRNNWGVYIHIMDTMEICRGPFPKSTGRQKKYKKKYGDMFQYMEYSNVFLDVWKVQNAMVNFYKVKVGGVQHIS